MFKLIRFTGLLALVVWVASCGNRSKVPDVSGIPMRIEIRRFDQDFFALDTNKLEVGLTALQARYPQFLPQYLQLVLGVPPQAAGGYEAIRSFLQTYQPVQTQAAEVASKALPTLEQQLKLGLQLMQHYLPQWKAEQPFELVTFVGPMDAYEPFATGDYGDVRTSTGVGIALQLHLGAQAPIYETGLRSGILNEYQTRRFTPDMMVVNAMKAVIEDAFPYRANGGTLLEEMIEKGKRLYLLQQTLPRVADSLQLGYTAAQWKGCLANEALIWNYFVKNDLLFSKEPMMNQLYLKDGPKTPELGEGAPGYIGLFVGRRIVEQFMKNQPSTTMDALMKMPAMTVFENARYKP